MTASFKLKPIVIAMMPILFTASATSAYAQEANQKPSPEEVTEVTGAAKVKAEEDETEIINVTGYRGSLLRSLNDKRLADGVQDSVFAEDIGKTTDQNIADALSRITGVTVQEADGEGTRISIRGAGADRNVISLNGVALTSGINGAGGNGSVSDESVDLSTFSADILSAITVQKTASADQDEGSLGANVILKTFKPLNVDKDRRSVEIQGRYNDYAEKNNFKFSGSFSDKFLDDTLGIIVTASKETQDTRRDSLGSNWLSPYLVVPLREGGARNEAGEIVAGGEDVIVANGRSFNTFVNSRDRDTATVGFQYLLGDATDIQLDLSYSKQTFNQDSHSIGTNIPNLNSADGQNLNNWTFDDGVPERQAHLGLLFTDPQEDWWTINEQSRTLVKSINRFGSGSFGRNVSGNETENKVATLAINHEWTDDLRMEFLAGYSRTNFEALPNASLRTANWARIPLPGLRDVPVTNPDGTPELQPVGYDCSSGKCILVVGDVPVSYVPINGGNAQSNYSPSGFSPYDLSANHLSGISRIDEQQIDENKSVFLNFDYDVDFVGITQIEFGAKYSSREKDVYTDYQDFSNVGDIVVDAETGELISAGSAADILVADILVGTGLPVNNFFEDLLGSNADQYNTDYLNGWAILDPDKAFAERFNVPNTVLNRNDAGSRRITQENYSLYTKLNFELLDSRLTGNVGIRYVHTENESFGNSSFNFNSQNRIFDPYDLIYNRQLANESLEACSPLQQNPDGTPINFDYVAQPQCYNSALAGVFIADNGDAINRGLLINYENGVVTDPLGQYELNIPRTNSTRGWFGILAHRDTTTNEASAAALVENGTIENLRDISARNFAGVGENDSDIWLPSLNVNYAVNDELIARFAASKTMSRPYFDSLSPGFRASENLWGVDGSTIRNNNPKLQPLTSNNLDLSLEWYFDKGGIVSLALFHKDMKNFVQEARGEVFLTDIRSDYDITEVSLEDIIIQPGEETDVINPNFTNADGSEVVTTVNEVTPLNSDCLPVRLAQNQVSNVIPIRCQNFQATFLVNGAGAVTKGLEFGYQQNYDFLPGLWSGLGVNFNYTFADSENETQFVELINRTSTAVPQPYTPRHSANTTLFWEKDGNQIRLAHRYNSDQLVGTATNGIVWQESTARLDLTATYQFNKNLSFSFHALNLTDDITRTYFTSTGLELDGEVLDEGNALVDDVYTGRTVGQFKTGRTFRFSARYNF
jgi:TonB-dependent receptor